MKKSIISAGLVLGLIAPSVMQTTQVHADGGFAFSDGNGTWTIGKAADTPEEEESLHAKTMSEANSQYAADHPDRVVQPTAPATTPSYSAPAESYSAPAEQPAYTAPAQTYSAPTQTYSAPATSTTTESQTTVSTQQQASSSSSEKPAKLPKDVADVVNQKIADIIKNESATMKVLKKNIKLLNSKTSSAKTKFQASTKIDAIAKEYANKASLAEDASFKFSDVSTSVQKAAATQQALAAVRIASVIGVTKNISNEADDQSGVTFGYSLETVSSVLKSLDKNNLKVGSTDYIQFTNVVRIAVEIQDSKRASKYSLSNKRAATEVLTKAKAINSKLTATVIKAERKLIGETIKSTEAIKPKKASVAHVESKHNNLGLIIGMSVAVIAAVIGGVVAFRKHG